MKGCRPLTDDEVRSVWTLLGKGTNPLRDRALFLLGLRSGFRISELLSLRILDVYAEGHFGDRVSVARKHMKKKMEGRTVVLHPEAKAALEQWVHELLAQGHCGETFIFKSRKGRNQAMDRRTAWGLLKNAYRQAGLTGKLGTHTMRKTFAKRVHEKLGRDILKTKKAMGHKDINSTVSYLSFAEEEIDDAILKS